MAKCRCKTVNPIQSFNNFNFGFNNIKAAQEEPPPPVPDLLLDIYPNDEGGWSLRKLRALYLGPAIRVRRSSDNAEADIGYSATLDVTGNYRIDTVALLAHTGANDGFVTRFYDNGVNARDLLQATNIRQPRIVNAGVVELMNGYPSLRFASAVDTIGITGLAVSNNNWSSSILWESTDVATLASIFRCRGTGALGATSGFTPVETTAAQYAPAIVIDDGAGNYVRADAANFGGVAINTPYLNTTIGTPNTIDIWENTVQEVYVNNGVTPVGASQISQIWLGSLDGTQRFMNGFVSEAVLWGLNQTVNRVGIEANINTAHGL